MFELVEERDRVELDHRKSMEHNPFYKNDPINLTIFEKNMRRLNEEMRKRMHKIELTAVNINSLNRKYEQSLNQYSNLKTREGRVTFSMVVTLSGSIIVLLPLAYSESFLSLHLTYMKLIATLLFSASIVLLVLRVHIHGRDQSNSL